MVGYAFLWDRVIGIKKAVSCECETAFFIVNILIKFVLYLVLELVYVLLLIPKGFIHK